MILFRKLRSNILKNIILPLVDLFFDTKATSWLKKIRQLGLMSKEDIANYQLEQLQQFIQHAYDHTRFYKHLFNSIGLKPSDINSVEDLQKIPVLTKEIIRDNYEKFIPDNLSHFKFRKNRSGGTTGVPLHFLCDENTWGYITAAKIIAWEKTGYLYGDSYIALGSSSLIPGGKMSFTKLMYFLLRNGIALNGVAINDRIAAEYVNIIVKKSIRYIYGYTSSIFLLAEYILKMNINISSVFGVFTTSEILTDYYREIIEKAFNTKIQDGYGARDAGITAFENAEGYYNVGYNTVVEIDNRTSSNTGSLVCTNFLNYAFPLIRYEFGDEVELLSTPFTKYNGQVIKKINGRTSDVMRLDNGRNLSSTGFSILMKEFNVLGFRMTKISGLKVLVEIQVKPSYKKEEEELIYTTMKNYCGEDCIIRINYVREFESLPNGKWNYFRVG